VVIEKAVRTEYSRSVITIPAKRSVRSGHGMGRGVVTCELVCAALVVYVHHVIVLLHRLSPALGCALDDRL
jgi:hypothetical protein